jgi:hypothetical protein
MKDRSINNTNKNVRGNTNLRNAEVGENQTPKTSGSPNEEHFDFKAGVSWTRVDEVGGGVGNSPIPKPVRGSGERHGFGTDTEIEYMRLIYK